ncbi:major facilitator superfamily domain-containing protein [Aspergillus transmontanensis]|uniref:Major facilitator superfamily domain-containing protein n=1 Tax=Aspergillus transmontanensis TaxID=1034304 RepID=A0A5N6VHV9_9EURO|nr:major facilitator superfamily domain-containing protein [Aspergillus transmontanensis]
MHTEKNKSDIPPEGGLRGWLVAWGSFLALDCTSGFLNAHQNRLSDYAASDILWIFAVQIALMWIPGPLFGRLIDAYSADPVLYPCSVLYVFALCITSLATEYYQVFLAQRLAFGTEAGGVFTAALLCVDQWFIQQRVLATRVAAARSSLKGVIFPIFIDRIVAEVGFYGAVRYTALCVNIIRAISCCLMRTHLPCTKWNGKAKWFGITLSKEKHFAIYTIGRDYAPFNYISSFAITAGFSPTRALYKYRLLNATSVPGRASILALWLSFNYHPSNAGITVFALVYEFVSGSFVSLLMPCVAKAGSLETLGLQFGSFQMIIGVSCLAGLPIMASAIAAAAYLLGHLHQSRKI